MIAGDIRNRDRVMLVDDVITTGNSLRDARETIAETSGGIVVHEVVLLDRRDERSPGTIALINPAHIWSGGPSAGPDPWWGSQPCWQCIAEDLIFTSRPTVRQLP